MYSPRSCQVRLRSGQGQVKVKVRVRYRSGQGQGVSMDGSDLTMIQVNLIQMDDCHKPYRFLVIPYL